MTVTNGAVGVDDDNLRARVAQQSEPKPQTQRELVDSGEISNQAHFFPGWISILNTCFFSFKI